jgi:hypothetical protein
MKYFTIKTSRLAALFVAGILFVLNSFAQTDKPSSNHTPEQVNAIKHFAFQGVGLGTTYAQVKAKYPDITYSALLSDPQALRAVWEKQGGDNDVSLTFTLYNGRLYDIGISYPDDVVTKMGGYEAVYNSLVAKYGQPDEDSTKTKGRDEYKVPRRLCGWLIPVGNRPGEAISINFQSGYGPLTSDKDGHYMHGETKFSVTDLNVMWNQMKTKDASQKALQDKANVGF